MFTVDDLKPGCRVVLHNGHVGIYGLHEMGACIYGKDFIETNDIRLFNGINNDYNDYAIEKVYGYGGYRYWELNESDLIWQYGVNNIIPKPMTIKEIEKALGHKIAIIDGGEHK